MSAIEEAGDRKGLGLVRLTVFCLFAAVILGIGQHTFYREDGFQLVYHFLMKGNVAHDIHPLYLPVADAFTGLFAFTGLGVFRLASLFSALTTVAGMFFIGLLARRAGLDSKRGSALVILVGFCPPVAFFASVVEFHAFFFMFACLAFWVAEGFMAPPAESWSPRRALLPLAVAGCTVTASLAHSTGTLLVPLIGAWVAARVGVRGRLGDLVLFAAIHLGLLFGLRDVTLRVLGMNPAQSNDIGQWFSEWLQLDGLLTRAGSVLLWEVFLSYLPHSLVFLLAFGARRRQVIWAGLGFLPYYLLCVAVLADRETGEPIFERGSYLLPLAIPAAWIIVQRLPVRALALVGAVCVLGSATLIRFHDERPGREFGRAVRAMLDGRETIVLCSTLEMPWAVIELPAAKPFFLAEVLTQPGDVLVPWMTGTLDKVLQGGGRVLLTERARDELGNASVQPQGAALRAALKARYRMVALSAAGATVFDVRSQS